MSRSKDGALRCRAALSLTSLVGLVALIGCGNKAEGTGVPDAAAGPTGVTECDDYLRKMEACLAKADESGKARMAPGFISARASITNPTSASDKGTLKRTCQAMEAGMPSECK